MTMRHESEKIPVTVLTGYLGGATCTHIRAEESKFIVPVLLGVFVWLGLFFHDNRIRALIPWKKP